MGAWGEAVFESDSAEEWAERLTSQNRTTFVLSALRGIAKVRAAAVLEADQCACALAAAEVIAAAQGHPSRELPAEIREWLAERRFVPRDDDVRLARDAVARIAANSELRTLWDNDRSWKTGVRKLLERIERSPRRQKLPARKPAAAQKEKQKQQKSSSTSTAGLVKLSDVRKIVKQRRGGIAVIKGEVKFIGMEKVLFKDLVALAACPECQTLKELSIEGSGITDRGMEHVGQLKNLRDLEIRGPKVTDAGVAYLQSLPNLDSLSLRRTQITDAGLKFLANLKSLRSLSVDHSKVSAAGLKKIGRQLGCHVFSDVLK
ncbi:MAG: DUF4259 domain-containing protein [Planctomycetaceae bacterium]